jgi:hypothetical protein
LEWFFQKIPPTFSIFLRKSLISGKTNIIKMFNVMKYLYSWCFWRKKMKNERDNYILQIWGKKIIGGKWKKNIAIGK